MNTEWISVEDRMPESRIRVWASSGPLDIGHDCFFGQKGCSFEEAARLGRFDFGEPCWRRTLTEQPVPQPIRFWQSLPDPPG